MGKSEGCGLTVAVVDQYFSAASDASFDPTRAFQITVD